MKVRRPFTNKVAVTLVEEDGKNADALGFGIEVSHQDWPLTDEKGEASVQISAMWRPSVESRLAGACPEEPR